MNGSCSPETCESFDEETVKTCGCEDSSSNTVVDVLLADTGIYSTLVNAVTTADLVETLKSAQDITLFAPNNAAFEELEKDLPGTLDALQGEDFGPSYIHLANLLSYHVLTERLPSSKIFEDLTVGEETIFPALSGDDVAMRINKNDKIFADENRIIEPDTLADNGVIHTVEGVLLPPWADKSILDLVADTNPVLNGLMQQDASIAESLSGPGPFTVFAPATEAIQAQLESLSQLGIEGDADVITSMLNYHVVQGIKTASDITDGLELPTVEGGNVVFKVDGGSVFVNDNEITSTDTLAVNGIIHVIQGVLLPASISDIDV